MSLDREAIAERLEQAPEATDEWMQQHRPVADVPPPDAPIDPPPPGDGGGDDGDRRPAKLRNELADAERLVIDLVDVAWYCPQLADKGDKAIESGWLIWDGQRLAPSKDGAIFRAAMQTALAISAEYEAQADQVWEEVQELAAAVQPSDPQLKALRARYARLQKKADQMQSEDRIKKMISLARRDVRLLIDQGELDADWSILNTPTGVVDLRTGQLHPHDPKWRCTRITAAEYDPQADTEPLTKALSRICMRQGADGWEVDHDRITYLQHVLGQALFGHQRWQRFWICEGKGGDGKGTLFQAVLKCLGSAPNGYAMKAATASFIRSRVAAHRIRDDLANMAGARIVIASEVNKGDELDAQMVKTLTGEDTQRVRKLYGDEFEFDPVCSLFFQVNHRPRVDSQDDAFWRRLVAVPFGPPIPEHERDPEVAEWLRDIDRGGKALLAWMVAGAVATADMKQPQNPASVVEATASYRDEVNPLAGWLLEELRFADEHHHKGTHMAAAAIQKSYAKWLEDSGGDPRGKPLTSKRFADELRALGCYSKQSRATGKSRPTWFGVTLRYENELSDEYCTGSYIPSEDMHLQHLRAHDAAPRVWLFGGNPIGGDPRAEKYPTRACEGDSFFAPDPSKENRPNNQTPEPDGGAWNPTDLDLDDPF